MCIFSCFQFFLKNRVNFCDMSKIMEKITNIWNLLTFFIIFYDLIYSETPFEFFMKKFLAFFLTFFTKLFTLSTFSRLLLVYSFANLIITFFIKILWFFCNKFCNFIKINYHQSHFASPTCIYCIAMIYNSLVELLKSTWCAAKQWNSAIYCTMQIWN